MRLGSNDGHGLRGTKTRVRHANITAAETKHGLKESIFPVHSILLILSRQNSKAHTGTKLSTKK